MPLLSILIPTYNREKYIRECIMSVLRQSFTDFEVIISDNGSSDMTVKIAEECARSDCRLRILRHSTNRGAVANWMACMKAASGQYIHWLWSDDYIGAGIYNEWYDRAGSHSTAMPFGCGTFIHESTGEIRDSFSYAEPSLSALDFRASLGLGQKLPITPAAYIIPIQAIRRHFYTDIPTNRRFDCVGRAIGPDWLMIAGAIIDAGGLICTSRRFLYCRRHAESISITSSDHLKRHYDFAVCWFIWREKILTAPWQRLIFLGKAVRYMSFDMIKWATAMWAR